MNSIEQHHIEAMANLLRDYASVNLQIPAGTELKVTIELVPTEVINIVDETRKVHPETWNLEAKASFLCYSPSSNRVANRLNFYSSPEVTRVRDVFRKLKHNEYFRGIAEKSKRELWDWLNSLNITRATEIPPDNESA